jgi:hypothetical protein
MFEYNISLFKTGDNNNINSSSSFLKEPLISKPISELPIIVSF